MTVTLFLIAFGILFAILHPALTFAGAAGGLQIWFFHLLPTLLPFVICANFFLAPTMKHYFADRFSAFHRLPFPPAYFLVLITGYSFGLPVGAKITVNLMQNKSLTQREAQILLNHCNVIGPAFITGFLITQCLQRPSLQWLTLAVIYLPQLVSLIVQLWYCHLHHGRMGEGRRSHKKSLQTSKETPRLRNCFQILDVAIMNGFETITVLGGYLILFGILCAFVRQMNFIPAVLKNIVLGLCEITTGINEIAGSSLSFSVKYLSCTTLCTFGGLCTAMQTLSIIKSTGLSIKKYLIHKFVFAAITLVLTYGALVTLY